MNKTRNIHPDFLYLLQFKEQKIIDLFKDLREFIHGIYPCRNELLYHTHALTAVFSISEKLTDAFCMISIYTNHLNLGFNKGTGNLIRHIPVDTPAVYRNKKVKDLIQSAVDFAIEDMENPAKSAGKTISKIKKNGKNSIP